MWDSSDNNTKATEPINFEEFNDEEYTSNMNRNKKLSQNEWENYRRNNIS